MILADWDDSLGSSPYYLFAFVILVCVLRHKYKHTKLVNLFAIEMRHTLMIPQLASMHLCSIELLYLHAMF